MSRQHPFLLGRLSLDRLTLFPVKAPILGKRWYKVTSPNSSRLNSSIHPSRLYMPTHHQRMQRSTNRPNVIDIPLSDLGILLDLSPLYLAGLTRSVKQVKCLTGVCAIHLKPRHLLKGKRM
jgi:hypothetical protein